MHPAATRLASVPGPAARLVLDFLLPPRCLTCDARVSEVDGLCADCWQKVQFIEKPLCHRLGLPFSHDIGDGAWSPQAIANPPPFDRLRAVAIYDGAARDLVLGLKFGRRRDLARPMGRWMARAGNEFLDRESILVPVPLHWFRLLTRRFNQSADLARAVAQTCGGQFEPGLLKRRKRTRQQVGLTAKERWKNVRSAFSVDPARRGDLLGRHVVLIDDVMTTGSTVAACSKILLSAGAASVDVLSFALVDPSHTSSTEPATS
ncbi:ComF family protein [Roseibium sp.]|uniref:ComF family protein n=1 Tax=Roseibium sp. TaxID=1936156 RepID=UPI003D0C3077